MAQSGQFVISALEAASGARKEKNKSEKVEEQHRKRELESRLSSLLQPFVLLAQWPGMNATHRASLLERRGYLCDRMQDGKCVRMRDRVRVCSAFVARCKIEFVSLCLLMGVRACVCVCACVCVSSLDVRRERTASQ